MAITPDNRLPQFITDGGIETHIIFNMGVELPHFSAFPLNDSAAGRDVIRSYYRDYLPVALAASRSFLFATDSWRASPEKAGRCVVTEFVSSQTFYINGTRHDGASEVEDLVAIIDAALERVKA